MYDSTATTCTSTSTSPDDQGHIYSLAVARTTNGDYQGWAVGNFGGGVTGGGNTHIKNPTDAIAPKAVLMRLGAGAWRRWTADDAAKDYPPIDSFGPQQQLTIANPAGGTDAYILPGGTFPSLRFDRKRDRWVALRAPFWTKTVPGNPGTPGFFNGQAIVEAITPDGEGGFWAALHGNTDNSRNLEFFFYHYTDHPPKPVFQDVANPAENTRVTASAAGADASFWLGDANGNLHRYDRLTGWDKTKAPDWDPKRATTTTPCRRSPSTPTETASPSARRDGSPTSHPDRSSSTPPLTASARERARSAPAASPAISHRRRSPPTARP